MLKLVGPGYRHCVGVTRRQFLTAGALTMGGFSLADLLRAEAAAGVRPPEFETQNQDDHFYTRAGGMLR